MKVKLTNEKLRYIALFEKLTGVTPRDCIESENEKRLTFVIDRGDMGRAIGENGGNVRKVREKMDKSVNVVEYSEDPEEFLENIFAPADIQNIEFKEEKGERTAVVEVEESEKGRVVGRNGRNIKRARKLSNRHHGTSDIILA